MSKRNPLMTNYTGDPNYTGGDDQNNNDPFGTNPNFNDFSFGMSPFTGLPPIGNNDGGQFNNFDIGGFSNGNSFPVTVPTTPFDNPTIPINFPAIIGGSVYSTYGPSGAPPVKPIKSDLPNFVSDVIAVNTGFNPNAGNTVINPNLPIKPPTNIISGTGKSNAFAWAYWLGGAIAVVVGIKYLNKQGSNVVVAKL